MLLVTRRGTEPLHEEVVGDLHFRGHHLCWRLHCQRCLAQTSLIKKSLKPLVFKIWRCLTAAHTVWWAMMVVMIVGMVTACSLKKHWMMRQSSHGSQNKTCKLV